MSVAQSTHEHVSGKIIGEQVALYEADVAPELLDNLAIIITLCEKVSPALHLSSTRPATPVTVRTKTRNRQLL